MLDLRFPIGVFFTILGLVLIAIPRARAELTSAPVNLFAGLAMLIFGVGMILLAARRR